MPTIRMERPEDKAQIREVNVKAFDRKVEADIIDVLRESCHEYISIVAEEGGRVVGHILFTPTIIHQGETQLVGSGLAPLAVLPEYQRIGIGSALMHAGLDRLRADGEPFVALYGHPSYYPRFGFERASSRGIKSEFDWAPDDAFMILVLDEDRMRGVTGVLTVRPEFVAGM
jgi:putative acetyltransferase